MIRLLIWLGLVPKTTLQIDLERPAKKQLRRLAAANAEGDNLHAKMREMDAELIRLRESK